MAEGNRKARGWPWEPPGPPRPPGGISSGEPVAGNVATGGGERAGLPLIEQAGRRGLPVLGAGAHEKDGSPGWVTTKLDYVVNWARQNSLWPMPFGTACCAIEMMATAATKNDLARFGMERMSFSPRQADLFICAGRVSYKMAPVLRKIWDQMPQPKWAISMGACASSGGVFDAYSMVQGIDTIMPVDVYVPGCPPRPEGLIYGILMLHEKIRGESLAYDSLRAEDPERSGRANLPPATIEQIALPFGNSTQQNKPGGLVGTGSVAHPDDRRP